MIIFLKTIKAKPNVSCRLFQNTNICAIAGKAIPMADKQKAPTSEMNNSKFGIAAAIITEIKWMN